MRSVTVTSSRRFPGGRGGGAGWKPTRRQWDPKQPPAGARSPPLGPPAAAGRGPTRRRTSTAPHLRRSGPAAAASLCAGPWAAPAPQSCGGTLRHSPPPAPAARADAPAAGRKRKGWAELPRLSGAAAAAAPQLGQPPASASARAAAAPRRPTSLCGGGADVVPE